MAGKRCWLYHPGEEDFVKLMEKYCSSLFLSQDETKFETCEILRSLVLSSPKSSFEDEPWLKDLQRGLRDILFSKIGKKQRDPALKLAAAVIDTTDFEWCLTVDAHDGSKGKFLLVLVNLACIEVIMTLEEKKIEHVLDDAELMVSCFSIMESAVSYMANERLGNLGQKQWDQLHTALKNAYSAVLQFLAELSVDLEEDREMLKDDQKREFVCATIRILAAWLSEETMAQREEVYEILKFVTTLAIETFEAQKVQKLQSLPGRFGSSNGESNALNTQGRSPDVFRMLLPGLCHLVAEEKPRKILLQLGLHETLHSYFSYHWSIYDSFRTWLNQKKVSSEESEELEMMVANAKFEMNCSNYALISICNVLMNIAVLEPQFVDQQTVFFHILRFIINVLPTLDNAGESLVLCGNLSVLGLFILKDHTSRPNSSDIATLKFVQAVVRFLWDAHNCEESSNQSELGVSSTYLEAWSELEELWFLGMQVLSSLLQPLPWLSGFVRDSGWAQDVVKTFDRVRKGGLEQGPKAAFDDFLTNMVNANDEKFKVEMKKNQAVIGICQKHQLRQLASAISK